MYGNHLFSTFFHIDTTAFCITTTGILFKLLHLFLDAITSSAVDLNDVLVLRSHPILDLGKLDGSNAAFPLSHPQIIHCFLLVNEHRLSTSGEYCAKFRGYQGE